MAYTALDTDTTRLTALINEGLCYEVCNEFLIAPCYWDAWREGGLIVLL